MERDMKLSKIKVRMAARAVFSLAKTAEESADNS
jgi:hypothetical protein